MAKSQDPPTRDVEPKNAPKAKVKRTRRRLYDALPASETVTPPPKPEESLTQGQEALEVVRKYSLWSAGAGLVPLPLFDLAAFSVLQLQMLKTLTSLYEIEYSEQRLKIYTGTLLSTIAPFTPTGIVLRSMLKTVPIIGQVAGVTIVAATGGASTYALGKVFIQHFELGGTLLDFDPEKMRTYCEEQFAEAKHVL
jgi:uncharacterized protein (DUF697 family)